MHSYQTKSDNEKEDWDHEKKDGWVEKIDIIYPPFGLKNFTNDG